jgi:tRNA threonylcarbamoyladenosine biosynthesis protein TsaB
MLLAVDTSTRMLGAALYDGTRVYGEMVWYSQDHHTVELAPVIQALMTRVGVPLEELKVLAVALGPGSFTGLRIGLALIKGMAFSLHLPVVGVPTLDFLAAAQPARDLPLLAVLQAGRGRLAVGEYHLEKGRWSPKGDAEILNGQSLAQKIHHQTLICGELTSEERQILARKRKNVILASPAQSLRRPAFLAEAAWRRWKSGQTDNPAVLSPIYLHVGEPIPA